VPGAINTYATGINNASQIVGTFQDSTRQLHGFLYTGGSFTQIDAPGAINTWVYGINNASQIVGYFQDQSGAILHGFLYTGGSFTQIDVPGVMATLPIGINNASQIVGYFQHQGRRDSARLSLHRWEFHSNRRARDPPGQYGALRHQRRGPDRGDATAWSR
jgi:probable HAF family extracellular repeat protein